MTEISRQALFAVVKMLAEEGKPRFDDDMGDEPCALCHSGSIYEEHGADCPWRMAREIMGLEVPRPE